MLIIFCILSEFDFAPVESLDALVALGRKGSATLKIVRTQKVLYLLFLNYLSRSVTPFSAILKCDIAHRFPAFQWKTVDVEAGDL